MQVFDQAVERLPVLFFDARHAPEAAGGFGVTVGLRLGDHLVVLADAMIDEAAALGEQTQEVVGLTVIGRIRRGGGLVAANSGLTHRHGADRAAAGPKPTPVTGAV